MKLHYYGKYSGNETDLPKREHIKGSMQFREPDIHSFSIIINIMTLTIFFLLLIIMYFIINNIVLNSIGLFLALIFTIPHEFLHAIVFREDVYLYISFRLGILFVIGTEDMSRKRYILMCLLPNIILGFIPFIIFLFNPSWSILGSFGALSISMGAGDYYNVYLALTQMPKGSRTYLCGTHSFWYKP